MRIHHRSAPHLLRRSILACAIAVSVPATAATQQASAGGSTGTSARTALASATSDLRNLIVAQEAHFAEHARYATDLAATQFRASAGHAVRLLRPGTNGYGAELTGPAIAGSCVIFVNLPEAERPRTATEKKVFPEGEPACDGDGEVEAVRWAASSRFAVERTLAQLAKLQEQRFGRTGAYAASVAELDGFRPNPSITVTLEVTAGGAGGPGFLASGTHALYPLNSCLVRSGYGPWYRQAMTKSQRRRPTTELQVSCDDFAR
jgi:hypothetical protein